MAESDWAVVRRVQAGDTEAYAEIWLRHQVHVSLRIYKLTGDRDLAADLTADVFARALRSIGSYAPQGGRDFGAVLFTIARNIVTDYFRSARYRLDRLVDLAAENAMPGLIDDSPEGDPESTAVIRLALLTGMAHLVPEQRRCVALRYLEQRSTEETARAMGKTEGAIKALLYRALLSLRAVMTADDRPRSLTEVG